MRRVENSRRQRRGEEGEREWRGKKAAGTGGGENG